MIIRKPVDNNYKDIFYLLNRAFAPSTSEANVVKALKDADKIVLDLVIEKKSKIVAYICYTNAYDAGRNTIGLHLAPLGVMPGWQRQGFGQRIVEESLKAVGTERPLYVLGDPDYYRRFGFRLDKTQKSKFDPEGLHFMTLRERALPPRDVFYEEEFMI